MEDMQWFWDRLNDYLKAHDLKNTNQRNLVVEKFLAMDKHVDVESLHNVLKEEGHNVGLATIYRTMNLLKSAGLVIQHSFSEAKAVFEVSYPHTHHDHLVCLICGKVEEFVNEEIEKIQDNIAHKMGFKLLDHRLDLFGYCTDCQTDR